MKDDPPAKRYRELFDAVIAGTLAQALRIVASDPALVPAGMRILGHQKAAARVRRRHEAEGLLVPPVMIASITSQCNLSCAGCYMHARKAGQQAEMSPGLLSSLAKQAEDLGVSVLVLAGGEPFVRQDEIFSLAEARPCLLVPVFTNGLLIDDDSANRIAACKNIVPVISFEGLKEVTDKRRGSGVYDRLLRVLFRLKSRRVFFGCSVTITRENFSHATGRDFIRTMTGAGARVFTFVEYVPMEPGTEGLVLSREQKEGLPGILAGLERDYPALFIAFPGSEVEYGGCLAAGRGFVHVSPAGDLEPCPAAPVSDANLAQVPLATALRSRLLDRIRQDPALLTESAGGCALRANRVLFAEPAGRDNGV